MEDSVESYLLCKKKKKKPLIKIVFEIMIIVSIIEYRDGLRSFISIHVYGILFRAIIHYLLTIQPIVYVLALV